ncbi:hypothetical protein D9619_010130 [Psilocybe cf. subviscida]|uniref:Secreted protein n=1 Tax=Psilocybe cf. subviscida TaxID=2480587 RepID=A0A8H5ES29_9AGAR|nr:hypothetical protein D9619_010130 [Psilocybe cf. subviscida]
MKLFASFSLNTVVATVVIGAISVTASTAANVLHDVTVVCSDANSLNSALLAFPTTGGTLVGALSIHSASTSLTTALNTATTDTNNVGPSPMSTTDSAAICSALSSCAAAFQSIFNRFVILHPSFNTLPVGGVPTLIRQDVHALVPALSALEAALAAHFDSSAFSCLAAFEGTVDSSKAACLLAYP